VFRGAKKITLSAKSFLGRSLLMGKFNPVQSFITYDEIFPNDAFEISDFPRLISGLSRTDSIFRCSRINMMITQPEMSRFDGQHAVASFLMSTSEIDALNKAVSLRGSGRGSIIFFRGQILEFLRWITLCCTDHPNDGVTFESPDLRTIFLKGLLIASEFWSKRVFSNWVFDNDDMDIKKKMVLGSFRKSIEDQSNAPEIEKSLGRGEMLFGTYIQKHLNNFGEVFENKTGLTIEDYYSCMAAIFANFMNKDSSGIFNIHEINNVENKDILQTYLNMESQSIEQMNQSLWMNYNIDIAQKIPEYDYRKLRERPFFVAVDGRSIIIDPIFYSEKASIGPLFHVLDKIGEDIFSSFGYAFEDYTKDFLNRMFNPVSALLIKRFTSNVPLFVSKGKSLEIDGCLNDVSDLVLFEIKAVWLREDILRGNDYSKVVAHVLKKYGVSDDTTKGIGQLANIVKIIIDKQNDQLFKEFSQVKIIYPVLLVHDVFLSAPLYGQLLANEFRKLLTNKAELDSSGFRINNLIVKDLVLVTIEDLENIESLVKYAGFRDFLIDYSNQCSDRMTSVNNFIAASDYSQHIRHNKFLAAKSEEIFSRSLRLFFGEHQKD
jgi:hypothetical protein